MPRRYRAQPPTLAVERLHLSRHPNAPRAAGDFVTRILLDWQLNPVIPSASLAANELVANSMHTGTHINVSVAWNLGVLRLCVRDDGPDHQRPRYSHTDPLGRTLSVVAVLSRAFGVLPTSDGGKVIWAVLNAARPRSPTSPGSPEPATSNPAISNRESPVISGAPSPNPSPDGHEQESIDLRLYVAGPSPKSVQAIENLRRVCEEYLPGRYHIELIDLVEHPKLARGDEIIAVPTLVRLPEPMRKIIGDLSDTEAVLVGLQIRPAGGVTSGG